MNCPKCNLPVNDDAAFCKNCGASLEDISTEEMEKTMAIPSVKAEMIFSPDSEAVQEENPVAKKDTRKMSTSKKSDEKAKALKLRIMITVISFLVTFVIGLGICALVILNDDSNEPKVHTPVQKTENNEQIKSDDGTIEQIEPETVKIVDGSSIGVKEAKTIPIDAEFNFALECTFDSMELLYKEHSDTTFGYLCEVPTSFEKLYQNDTETRYCAADNSAYVDVGAFENEYRLSCDEVKDAIKKELNGRILREESDDDWFVMVTESDDVVYYIKCFVGSNVKYMEFVSPSQYSEVYNIFIDDMEPKFQSVR